MNDVQAGFAEFLARCWEGAPTTHSYGLPARGPLSGWRQFNSWWAGSREIWTARSLSEALEKYFWPAVRAGRDNPGNARTGDFACNRESLNCLRESLVKAIQEGNDLLAECVVYKIFHWGGVARRKDGATRTWVRKQARKGTLCRELARAVQLLKLSEAPLDAFRTRSLPMNSSMTKVYALADPEQYLIIYDGRVGAALGHLAKLHLMQLGQHSVPEELRFRWGGVQPPPPRGQRDPRNPSTRDYVFPPLFNVSRSDFRHAEMVRCASFLVSKCVSLIALKRRVKMCGASEYWNVSPREVEAALFMWGYRVT